LKKVSVIDKKTLRSEILLQLRAQKEEDRSQKSRVIADRLFQLSEFKSANTVVLYASFDGEVETHTMIDQALREGKKVGLPKINVEKREITLFYIESLENDTLEGPFGILEPKEDKNKKIDHNVIDLVGVPGVAFDKNNNRLGRGGGYYDRFLSTLPSHVSKVGLAFEFQILTQLPFEHHDVRLDHVLTN